MVLVEFKKKAVKQNGTQISDEPFNAYMISEKGHIIWGETGFIKKDSFEGLLPVEVLPNKTFEQWILDLERFPEDDDFIDDI